MLTWAGTHGQPRAAPELVAPNSAPLSEITGPTRRIPIWTVDDLSGEQRRYPDEIKSLLVKQRNGEQLTTEERQLLVDYMGVGRGNR
jgi:hypothetical protein